MIPISAPPPAFADLAIIAAIPAALAALAGIVRHIWKEPTA